MIQKLHTLPFTVYMLLFIKIQFELLQQAEILWR